MNNLHVPFLKTITVQTAIETASELIEALKMDVNTLEWVNWPTEFPEKPMVQFKIVQIERGLLIKFYVKEDFSRATYTIDNQEVYKDSCVELFIDPSGDGTYYNFEFNALGTLLLGFGADRHNRERAHPEITKTIKRLSSFGTLPFDVIQSNNPWHLTVMIPYTSFWHHSIESLEGKTVKGNFQKCGDNLTVPHFLTWNPIPTPRPDYHRPEYFGILQF